MKLTELNIKSTNSTTMFNGFFDDESIPTIPTDKLIVGPTGYFEGLVSIQSLAGIGCISKGIDTNGRKVIVIGTEHGNIVVFKRVLSEVSDRLAYNCPRRYESRINQLCTVINNLTPGCGLYKLIANVIMLQNADCSPTFELVDLVFNSNSAKEHQPIVKRSREGLITEIAFPVEDGFVMIELPKDLSVLPRLGEDTTSTQARNIVTDKNSITPEEVIDLIDLHTDHVG